MVFEICYPHAVCMGPRATKLPIPATGHVFDISIPDSFIFNLLLVMLRAHNYALLVMYMTFQYLTVSCIPAIGCAPMFCPHGA